MIDCPMTPCLDKLVVTELVSLANWPLHLKTKNQTITTQAICDDLPDARICTYIYTKKYKQTNRNGFMDWDRVMRRHFVIRDMI
jgi:hypothetical protein